MLKQNKNSIENSLIFYLFLTIISMNFLGHGSIFCLVFFAYCFIIKGFYARRLDFDAHVLLILSIVICIYSLIIYTYGDAVKSLNYFLLYFIAVNFYNSVEDKVLFIKRCVFSVFLGFGLHNCITYLYNAGLGFTLESRTLYSFWTSETMSVTLIGLTTSIVISYSFYGMFLQKKVIIKLLTLLFIAFSILLNFISATRTPVLMLVLNFAIMIILYTFSKNKNHKVLFGIIVFIIVIAIIYAINLFGIKSYILSLPIWDRFKSSGVDTTRGEIMKKYFELSFTYMFGGDKIYQQVGSSAHNFIQQSHSLYGIFASLPLIIISFSFLFNMYKLLKIKNKTALDLLLFSLYLCAFVQMMLEPVLTGYPILLWIMLFIHGLTNQYLRGK